MLVNFSYIHYFGLTPMITDNQKNVFKIKKWFLLNRKITEIASKAATGNAVHLDSGEIVIVVVLPLSIRRYMPTISNLRCATGVCYKSIYRSVNFMLFYFNKDMNLPTINHNN